jgi:transposase
MVRRDDAKTQALAASRTLNPRPERVTDPADLVQVKYEMVPRAEVAGVPTGQAAAAFGFSRQSLYSARTALRERGLAGLVPAKPGPKGGHKLTGQVVDLLEELLEADPGLRSAELAAAVWQRFGVSVHPRFGRAGAAAPPHLLARGRAGPRGGVEKPLTSPAPATRPSPVMTVPSSPGGMRCCAAPRPPGAADGGTA